MLKKRKLNTVPLPSFSPILGRVGVEPHFHRQVEVCTFHHIPPPLPLFVFFVFIAFSFKDPVHKICGCYLVIVVYNYPKKKILFYFAGGGGKKEEKECGFNFPIFISCYCCMSAVQLAVFIRFILRGSRTQVFHFSTFKTFHQPTWTCHPKMSGAFQPKFTQKKGEKKKYPS